MIPAGGALIYVRLFGGYMSLVPDGCVAPWEELGWRASLISTMRCTYLSTGMRYLYQCTRCRRAWHCRCCHGEFVEAVCTCLFRFSTLKRACVHNACNGYRQTIQQNSRLTEKGRTEHHTGARRASAAAPLRTGAAKCRTGAGAGSYKGARTAPDGRRSHRE